MVQIEWTRRALQDLREIFDFIAKDSRYYAQLQVERIQDDVTNLASFPNMGHSLSEFPDSQYLEIGCGNYRIIYRIDEEQNRLLILSIIHYRRILREP